MKDKTPSQRGRANRRKGASTEVEIAKLWQELGFDARRGRQIQAGPYSPDVWVKELAEFIWIECKARKTGGFLLNTMNTAEDAAGSKYAMSIFKYPRHPPICAMWWRDFANVVRLVAERMNELEEPS